MPEPAPTYRLRHAPTASAAFSLVMPVAICCQNCRSTSRRCDGAPGDRIASRPVNFCIQLAGRPINTSLSKVLRRPVESTQFDSDDFNRWCKDNYLVPSMSRPGNCWDNAVVESFFSSLKKERIKRRIYASRQQAKSDVFDYIEGFYNRVRRHSHLDQLSPLAFEQLRTGS